MGTISVREIQAVSGTNWCAEWTGNRGYKLVISNGATLPPQTEIQQCGTPNTRGSLIVDYAKSERLIGSTAANFLSSPRSHDILIDDTGFRYV